MAHMAIMKHSRLTESAENDERKEQLYSGKWKQLDH
jgi:hypothetical protein